MVDSWYFQDWVVPEGMSQVARQLEVGNHKPRTLNTRLSSGTSAGTFACPAGPYINYSNEAGTKKRTWNFLYQFLKGSENRSSRFEPKILWISFSRGSGPPLKDGWSPPTGKKERKNQIHPSFSKSYISSKIASSRKPCAWPGFFWILFLFCWLFFLVHVWREVFLGILVLCILDICLLLVIFSFFVFLKFWFSHSCVQGPLWECLCAGNFTVTPLLRTTRMCSQLLGRVSAADLAVWQLYKQTNCFGAPIHCDLQLWCAKKLRPPPRWGADTNCHDHTFNFHSTQLMFDLSDLKHTTTTPQPCTPTSHLTTPHSKLPPHHFILGPIRVILMRVCVHVCVCTCDKVCVHVWLRARVRMRRGLNDKVSLNNMSLTHDSYSSQRRVVKPTGVDVLQTQVQSFQIPKEFCSANHGSLNNNDIFS